MKRQLLGSHANAMIEQAKTKKRRIFSFCVVSVVSYEISEVLILQPVIELVAMKSEEYAASEFARLENTGPKSTNVDTRGKNVRKILTCLNISTFVINLGKCRAESIRSGSKDGGLGRTYLQFHILASIHKKGK